MNRKMTAGYDHFLDMIRNEDYLILDTETTGLHEGEICSIAIIDKEGKVLLDTFVRPVNEIPQEAIDIHGITNAKVALHPRWGKISTRVLDIVQGKNVVIYNSDYDVRMLHQSDRAIGDGDFNWYDKANWFCAMTAYAEFYGDWNEYRQSYKWQKLSEAMRQQGYAPINAHAALGDCLMTRQLCERMASIEYTESTAVQEAIDEEDLGLG